MITKDQLKGGGLPPGTYLLEIRKAEPKSGTSQAGRAWECLNLTCAVVEPEDKADRLTFLSVFYDKTMGDLITVGLGKSLDAIFGKDDKIDAANLIAQLVGGFVRLRLGVNAKGFNTIEEVMAPAKEADV